MPAQKKRRRDPRHDAFLASVSRGNTIGFAAGEAGVTRRTVYLWRENDPEFAAAWDEAWTNGRDALVQTATTRATDHDSTLLMFLIKQRDPTFRERSSVEVTGADGGPIELAIDEARGSLATRMAAIAERREQESGSQ